ncbi:MAG: carbohydrate kinase family protein [Candidatus Hodarchaeota archaeon]
MYKKIIIVGEMHEDLFYRNDSFTQMEGTLAGILSSKKNEMLSMSEEEIKTMIHKVISNLPKKVPGNGFIKRGGNGNNSTELFGELGIPVKLMTVLGRGSGWMINEMRELGVDTSCIYQIHEMTPISTIIDDPSITKIYVAPNLKSKMNFSTITIDPSSFSDASLVFFTPLAEKFKPVLDVLQSTNKEVLTVVTIESQGIPSLDVLEKVLTRQVDIIITNETDALSISGKASIDDADEIFKKFSSIRVYTMAAKGSLIKSSGCEDVPIPIFKVKVLDRTGAGDAFAAGFLLKCHEFICDGGFLAEYMKVEEMDRRVALLKEFGTFGAAVAALKISQARTPTSEEVSSFITTASFD